MTTCKRCGDRMPRLSISQDHCPRCVLEVAAIIAADAKRRTRFAFAKAMDRA